MSTIVGGRLQRRLTKKGVAVLTAIGLGLAGSVAAYALHANLAGADFSQSSTSLGDTGSVWTGAHLQLVPGTGATTPITVTNALPGQSGSKSFTLTNGGNIGSNSSAKAIRAYAKAAAFSTTGVDHYIHLTLTAKPTGSATTPTKVIDNVTLDQLAEAFAGGYVLPDLAAGATDDIVVSWQVDPNTPNTLQQAASTPLTLVFEQQASGN